MPNHLSSHDEKIRSFAGSSTSPFVRSTWTFQENVLAKERIASIKFGEKNRSFVTKALAVAEGHPEILPASFNLVSFRHVADLIERLYPLLSAVEVLYGKLQDTYFAAGSDAYAAALTVYQLTKLHNETTGALEDSLNDLGRRFAHQGKKATPAPSSPTPADPSA